MGGGIGSSRPPIYKRGAEALAICLSSAFCSLVFGLLLLVIVRNVVKILERLLRAECRPSLRCSEKGSNADKAAVQQLLIGMISGEVLKYLEGFFLAIQKNYGPPQKPSSCSNSAFNDVLDIKTLLLQ